jgi:hypothetical protein
MVEAVNKQIEKAIEIIMAANEDENNRLPEMKNRSALSNENSKLTQIVHLRTECSKITRNALAEHGEALAQLLLMTQPSIEVTHRHRSKLGMGYGKIQCKIQKKSLGDMGAASQRSPSMVVGFTTTCVISAYHY